MDFKTLLPPTRQDLLMAWQGLGAPILDREPRQRWRDAYEKLSTASETDATEVWLRKADAKTMANKVLAQATMELARFTYRGTCSPSTALEADPYLRIIEQRRLPARTTTGQTNSSRDGPRSYLWKASLLLPQNALASPHYRRLAKTKRFSLLPGAIASSSAEGE